MSTATAESRFREAYGAHRAAEGRALDTPSLLALPYLTTGPQAKQWSVRARSYDAFVARVLRPLHVERGRALTVLDVGAGNAWLSARAAREGHQAIAIDVRSDAVDGLGAGAPFVATSEGRLQRIAGSFDALPVMDASADIIVFNASLHYAVDLVATLAESCRVLRSGGRIAVVDSPFYRRDADGQAMVAEKRRTARQAFGARAEELMALPFVEYLTSSRLEGASKGLGLTWRRHRVRYPLWYELRPLMARLRGARTPSRFDVWEGVVA